MNNEIFISNKTINLINEVNQCFLDQYVELHHKEQEEKWVTSYNFLKSDAWPNCINYNDFYMLPDEIRRECIEIHEFSPDIWKEKIIKNAKEHYLQTTNRISVRKYLNDFLLDHLDILKDNRILDVACRYGASSLILYQNGCTNILGIDVRENSIKIANSIKNDLNIKNEVYFERCDVHNYDLLTSFVKDKDVILFLGILNHIHDHFEVLRVLTSSNARYIFIETIEPDEIINNPIPLVSWKSAKTYESLAGYIENMDTILEGHPNQAWIDLTMSLFGFKKLSERSGQVPCFDYITNHKISIFEKVK